MFIVDDSFQHLLTYDQVVGTSRIEQYIDRQTKLVSGVERHEKKDYLEHDLATIHLSLMDGVLRELLQNYTLEKLWAKLEKMFMITSLLSWLYFTLEIRYACC